MTGVAKLADDVFRLLNTEDSMDVSNLVKCFHLVAAVETHSIAFIAMSVPCHPWFSGCFFNDSAVWRIAGEYCCYDCWTQRWGGRE